MARKGQPKAGKTKRAQGSNGGHTDTWVNGHAAHYRIRRVYCGKKCKACPHASYKYLVWREGGRIREQYVGVARGE